MSKKMPRRSWIQIAAACWNFRLCSKMIDFTIRDTRWMRVFYTWRWVYARHIFIIRDAAALFTLRKRNAHSWSYVYVSLSLPSSLLSLEISITKVRITISFIISLLISFMVNIRMYNYFENWWESVCKRVSSISPSRDAESVIDIIARNKF